MYQPSYGRDRLLHPQDDVTTVILISLPRAWRRSCTRFGLRVTGGGAKASLTRSDCSCSCRFVVPAAGLALSGRPA